MELLLLLLIAAVIFGVYRSRGGSKFKAPEVSPISKASLSAFEAAPSLWVNGAEASLFNCLQRHLPRGHHIHVKVRLEDIIRVRRDVNPKARWSLRGRVKSRHVDYLITNRAGRPVLVIELDGASHNPKNPSEADKVKTALFAAAGIPLRRIRVGEDFDQIVAIILAELRVF